MTVTTKQGKKQRREKDKIIIRHERRGPFKTETRWETRLQRSCLERTRREGSGIFARANIMKEKKRTWQGKGGEKHSRGGVVGGRHHSQAFLHIFLVFTREESLIFLPHLLFLLLRLLHLLFTYFFSYFFSLYCLVLVVILFLSTGKERKGYLDWNFAWEGVTGFEIILVCRL